MPTQCESERVSSEPLQSETIQMQMLHTIRKTFNSQTTNQLLLCVLFPFRPPLVAWPKMHSACYQHHRHHHHQNNNNITILFCKRMHNVWHGCELLLLHFIFYHSVLCMRRDTLSHEYLSLKIKTPSTVKKSPFFGTKNDFCSSKFYFASFFAKFKTTTN